MEPAFLRLGRDAAPRSLGDVIFALPATEVTVESILAYLEHYGMERFLSHKMRTLNLKDYRQSRAVDMAFDRHEEDNFSIKRAFNYILRDLMEEEGVDYEEALEMMAQEDYLIPVHVALEYSVSADSDEVEQLSALIRNRAIRFLKAEEAGSAY